MASFQRIRHVYVRSLRFTVMIFAAITGVSIMFMVLLTCADVVLRLFGNPIIGAYDLVGVAGAVSMSCALPYTTALKGHVAIEYFFQKLNRTWRIIVDTVVRLMGIGLFSMLARESARIGTNLKIRGEVTPTLQLPVYWVSWVIALACALVVLVIIYNMLNPGKELLQP